MSTMISMSFDLINVFLFRCHSVTVKLRIRVLKAAGGVVGFLNVVGPACVSGKELPTPQLFFMYHEHFQEARVYRIIKSVFDRQ